MSEDIKDWSLQYCEDAVFIPAPPEKVFDVLADIAGWNEWWETMRFEPLQPGPLRPGDSIIFDGVVSKWSVDVEAIEPPHSIRFIYREGALVGATEWRVASKPGGSVAAYIYHGVRATEDRAATTFGRFGTALHTMVMHADALDGLLRRVTGRPIDQTWRQSVRDAVAAGRARLIEEREGA